MVKDTPKLKYSNHILGILQQAWRKISPQLISGISLWQVLFGIQCFGRLLRRRSSNSRNKKDWTNFLTYVEGGRCTPGILYYNNLENQIGQMLGCYFPSAIFQFTFMGHENANWMQDREREVAETPSYLYKHLNQTLK